MAVQIVEGLIWLVIHPVLFLVLLVLVAIGGVYYLSLSPEELAGRCRNYGEHYQVETKYYEKTDDCMVVLDGNRMQPISKYRESGIIERKQHADQ